MTRITYIHYGAKYNTDLPIENFSFKAELNFAELADKKNIVIQLTNIQYSNISLIVGIYFTGTKFRIEEKKYNYEKEKSFYYNLKDYYKDELKREQDYFNNLKKHWSKNCLVNLKKILCQYSNSFSKVQASMNH